MKPVCRVRVYDIDPLGRGQFSSKPKYPILLRWIMGPASAMTIMEMSARGAKFLVQLSRIVVKGGDGVLAHQFQEGSDRETGQFGGLAIAEPALADLFKQPQGAHLLSDTLRIPWMMAQCLPGQFDREEHMIVASFHDGAILAWSAERLPSA